MSKWTFPVQKLVEDDPYRPDINFIGDERLSETLRSLIPVRPDAERCQLHILLICLNLLTQSKIANLNFTFVKQNVLWFEVKMDHLLLLTV